MNDSEGNVVASFKNGVAKRRAADAMDSSPGVLQILPDGLSMIDEIVATHVYCTRAGTFKRKDGNGMEAEGGVGFMVNTLDIGAHVAG